MVLKLSAKRDEWLDEAYEKAMADLDKFFEIGWKDNQPPITLIPDRKMMDFFRGRKTEEWEVAWTEGTKVFILDYNNLERESDKKFSKESYEMRLKHELTHCFVNTLCRKGPLLWINEGLAVAGQIKLNSKPKNFSKFLNFFNQGEKEVYYESGFAVEYLLKKFGREKLLNFVKKYDGKTKEEFYDLFKSIYDFDLAYKNFEVL